jgi:hypothetical protein
VTIRDELRPLESLKPHPRNYNLHGERQLIFLSDAMRHTAFTAPIICKSDGTILGGHLRRLALLKLKNENYPEPEGVLSGWRVPCRVVDCNAVDEMRILATDNPDPEQISYDLPALASLLTELQEQDALAGTWYDAARLDALISEIAGEDETGGEKEAPDEFDSYGEDIEFEHECPRCHYRFSGGKVTKTALQGPDDGGDSE